MRLAHLLLPNQGNREALIVRGHPYPRATLGEGFTGYRPSHSSETRGSSAQIRQGIYAPNDAPNDAREPLFRLCFEDTTRALSQCPGNGTHHLLTPKGQRITCVRRARGNSALRLAEPQVYVHS